MICYKRAYDLSSHNKDLLEKYNLEQKEYVYVGATTKPMYYRNAKWRYAILHNNRYVSKEIRSFIHNLKRFYKYELHMLNEEIDKQLFYTYEILAETNDYQMLRELEQVTNASYLMMEFINNDIVLLSKFDTKIKIDNNKIVIKNNHKIKINKDKNIILDKKNNSSAANTQATI